MVELLANLRDRDLTPAMLKVRGESYRRELDHLSDEAFDHAVKTAIRTLDWFPTVHQLLEFAAEAPQPARSLLSDDTRTLEEKRADAAKGLAMIRLAYVNARRAEHGLPPLPEGTELPELEEAPVGVGLQHALGQPPESSQP
jgi:hypothetical protein